MIMTADLLFVLLKVEADGCVGLEANQWVDLLELVGADLVEVHGPHFKLTAKGRHVLSETSRQDGFLEAASS